jgi:L-amino acid N-acyltransferase YncA
MRLVECTYDAHAVAILAIFNDAIVNSTALYDYVPRPPESMVGWFQTKQAKNFPVIGVESDAGELLGFASYGSFRAWPAYKYTVENGIYIHRDHRGKGLGRFLMNSLIERARSQDYHVIVAGIDMENGPSIALHKSLGFVHSGTIRHAGFKFNRWLDLGFFQLQLDTPRAPVESVT